MSDLDLLMSRIEEINTKTPPWQPMTSTLLSPITEPPAPGSPQAAPSLAARSSISPQSWARPQSRLRQALASNLRSSYERG